MGANHSIDISILATGFPPAPVSSTQIEQKAELYPIQMIRSKQTTLLG